MNMFKGNRKFIVEIGELAKQANGAVFVRFDDTAVLSVAVASKTPSTVDFFPLTVLYQERLYAPGKIPGGFLKREGRPTEYETLTSRLIDRPLRPLFPKGFRNEVQVVNTVLSANPGQYSSNGRNVRFITSTNNFSISHLTDQLLVLL